MELSFEWQKIKRSFAYKPNSGVVKYSKIVWRGILGEINEIEVTVYYASMKDAPQLIIFILIIQIDGQLFWSLNQNVGK